MMKKILALAVLLGLCPAAMRAQWVSDPSVNTQISDQKGATAGSIKVAKVGEDKMYVAWTSFENGGQTRLQLLDRDGNALWQKGGILVNKNPAASYTTDFSLLVDPEGCAIVVYSDTRTNLETKLDFKPFVYKIDQEGNYLWGVDGIAIPCKSHQGMRPRLCVTNAGSVIVGYSDAINGLFCIQKINEDGALAWGQNIELGGIMGNFVATGEDDFILTWFGGGLSAQRFDSYGEEVWYKPVVIEKGDKLNGHVEPIMVPDGEGGFVVCYGSSVGITEFYVCLQRVNAEGELMMGLESVTTGDNKFKHSNGTIGIDVENKEIVCQWTKRAAAVERLMVKKYDYFGDEIWGEEGIEIDQDLELGYFAYSVSVLDDQSSIIVYSDYQDNVVNNLIYAKKLDKDGKVVWSTKLNDVVAPKSGAKTARFNDQLCTFWCDRIGEVFGQNLSFDGKLGIVTTGIENFETVTPELYYSNQALIIATGEENVGGSTLQISDMAGSVVFQNWIVPESGQVSIPLTLKRGIYVVSLLQSQRKVIRKILVQ